MVLKLEERTQKMVVKWLKLQYPHVIAIKIDNEGKRSIVGHVQAKAMGLVVGASDLFIAYPTAKYAGLWLEVKPDGWTPSKTKKERLAAQLEFIEKVKAVGYWGEMGIGFEACTKIINYYLKE